MLMSLQSACWKFSQTDSGTATQLMDDWLSQFEALPHIHIGCINLFDVYSVAQIDVSFSGVWHLMDKSIFINPDEAKRSFSALKRQTRSMFKMATREGLLVPQSGCSERKIARSFDHLIENQGILLYNPAIDLLPQY